MRRAASIVSTAFGLAFFACATVPTTVQTPTGGAGGDLFKPMTVLGLSQRATCTGNLPDAGRYWDSEPGQPIRINIPVGTEAILVGIKGWWLMYGSQNPDYCSGSEVYGEIDDQHWGSGFVLVSVSDIDAPNFSVTPATQTATIRVQMSLRDNEPDDPWTGMVTYSLLFLGRQPRGDQRPTFPLDQPPPR